MTEVGIQNFYDDLTNGFYEFLGSHPMYHDLMKELYSLSDEEVASTVVEESEPEGHAEESPNEEVATEL